VPFRQFLFSRFWAFPLFALVVFALQKTAIVNGDMSAFRPIHSFLSKAAPDISPIALTIAIHFLVVAIAKMVRKQFGRDIDSVCCSVSDFLVVRCYEKRSLPSFLYMKSERVLIAVSCTLKIIFAVAYLIFYVSLNIFPNGLIGCSGNRTSSSKGWLWAFFAFIYVTEVFYHAALFLSGIIRAGVNESFAHIVLTPTYWQWCVLVIKLLF
jgi:hypothetical protein